MIQQTSKSEEALKSLIEWTLIGIDSHLLQALTTAISPYSPLPNEKSSEAILKALLFYYITQSHFEYLSLNQISINLLQISSTLIGDLQDSISYLIYNNSFIEYILRQITNQNPYPSLEISREQMKSVMEEDSFTTREINQQQSKEVQTELFDFQKISIINNCQVESIICLCREEGFQIQQNIYKCCKCALNYHKACLNSINKYCPFCQLQQIMPHYRIISQPFTTYLRGDFKEQFFQFYCPTIPRKQKLYCVSLRLSSNGINTPNFPDIFSIKINKQLIKQFKPLEKRSSQKNHRDDSVLIAKSNINPKGMNLLKFQKMVRSYNKEEYSICDSNYLIGLIIVEPETTNQMILRIAQKNIMTYKQSCGRLRECFEGQEQLQITSFITSIICLMSLSAMKIPVRGIFCKHYQCFDLISYVVMMRNQKSPKWKCPICNEIISEFMVDYIMFQIVTRLNDHHQFDHVQFQIDGWYRTISKVYEKRSGEWRKIQELESGCEYSMQKIIDGYWRDLREPIDSE